MAEFIVNAVAPTRICDIGGWTDTWFAQRGCVFSIAIYPHVEVQLFVDDGQPSRAVEISFENYGETRTFILDQLRYDHHPLIQAALDAGGLPAGVSVRANIYSAVPPGASTGTSAALGVALVSALDRLQGGCLTAHEVATRAHALETERLNLQSGVQDQLASAYGGISFIEITDYPHSSVSRVHVPEDVWYELEHRLTLVYVGLPHSSSEVHHQVIKSIGPTARDDFRIDRLRELARLAKSCVSRGDFAGLAKAMNANTAVQRDLAAGLVGEPFDRAMNVARRFGAEGFKVNGAGGDGGTLTILTDGDMARKRLMIAALTDAGFTTIPIQLAHRGVRSWTVPRS